MCKFSQFIAQGIKFLLLLLLSHCIMNWGCPLVSGTGTLAVDKWLKKSLNMTFEEV